ncbi:hypothetical protein OEB99_05290 [Actinotalea sp. M2MS4P-6]|uniref:hypothetical protein n=1 Tax=Actinotalea sp. M2MS4P-6 TaxID=2983762 RepID=UPI0021E50684|nr:hypothetical protein [Actinotalea sp. M2MS4P-6]MCV2393716.1 hypothetical protein [Actinotalea sp. M2MS4P-6]
MRRSIVVILVVVVLALVADQATRMLLEHRVAARMADAGLEPVLVHVAGWPVAPQLLNGELDVSVTTEVPFTALPALGAAVQTDGSDATADGTGSDAAADGLSALAGIGGPGTGGVGTDTSDPLITWSGENGLLVAQVGADGPRLAHEVGTQDGLLVVTPVSVQLAGLQVPVEMLGERAQRLLGAALDPHRVDPTALGLPGGVDFTGASVTTTGVLLTLTAPLDRVP